jgi:hypothetical protein
MQQKSGGRAGSSPYYTQNRADEDDQFAKK